MNEDEAREETTRAARLAQRMAIALADVVEETKDDASLIAKAHLILAHAILRNSVCCLPKLASGIVGFYSILEPIISDGRWDLKQGPHSH